MLFLSACDPEGAESPVLLQVGSRSLPLADFQQLFRHSYPDAGQISEGVRREMVQGLLRRTIDRELILAEADHLGISVSPAETAEAEREARDGYPAGDFDQALQQQGRTLVEWRHELAISLRIEKTVAQTVEQQVALTDEQVEAHYQQHQADFERPETRHVRQILVAEAEFGRQLLGRLRSGEDFVDLAREYSLTPERELGGDLGWLQAGQLPPEVETAVFALPVGRVSDLISSPYGEHLFLVEERLPAGRRTLEDVAGEIRADLQAEAHEQAFQAWLGHLRASIPLKVEWELLAEVE